MPLFVESPAMGRTPVLGNPVFEVPLYPFSITSSMMGMYECNTLAKGVLCCSLSRIEFFSRSLLGRNTIPPKIGERVTWKGDTIKKEKARPLIKRGHFITFFCLFLIMMSI